MTLSQEEMRREIEAEKLRQMMQGKSAGVAVFLSFLIPGLGDLYCGRLLKGSIFFLLDLVCVLLLFVGIGVLVFPCVWFLGLISAWMSASWTRKRGLHAAEKAVAIAAPSA
ncbi:MAG: hypothetical protein U0610_17580 [bacterium]